MLTISGKAHTKTIGNALLYIGTPQSKGSDLMDWGGPVVAVSIDDDGYFKFDGLIPDTFYRILYRIGPNKITDFCFRPLKESHVIDMDRYEDYE